jgi:hypothetical protein
MKMTPRKILITLVAFVIALTIAVVIAPGSASAGTAGEWWEAKAEIALSRFMAQDTGQGTAFGYGSATEAARILYGWEDERTLLLLQRLRSKKNPDGGYGLNAPSDSFNNGTVNPATTSYTVTMAGHVGFTLLNAYEAGLVPRSEIQTLVTLLVTTPRVPVARGQCLSYSRAQDDVAGGCVHNVNAGAGWFLQEAAAAGFGYTGMARLITDITIQELVAYRESQVWWPYLNSGPNQDTDHNSYSAASMYRLAYWVGREAIYKHLNNSYNDNANAPIAHMVLTSQPGGINSQGIINPERTLWCEMGDRWMPEAEAFLATRVTMDRLAQYAVAAAKNGNC